MHRRQLLVILRQRVILRRDHGIAHQRCQLVHLHLATPFRHIRPGISVPAYPPAPPASNQGLKVTAPRHRMDVAHTMPIGSIMREMAAPRPCKHQFSTFFMQGLFCI